MNQSKVRAIVKEDLAGIMANRMVVIPIILVLCVLQSARRFHGKCGENYLCVLELHVHPAFHAGTHNEMISSIIAVNSVYVAFGGSAGWVGGFKHDRVVVFGLIVMVAPVLLHLVAQCFDCETIVQML